jgi:hypothetical protein
LVHKIELHGNLLEDWHVLKDDMVVEFQLIFFQWVVNGFPFENEQLIDFLLIHNKVFTGYDRQILLILALLNRYHLVGFSCLSFQ